MPAWHENSRDLGSLGNRAMHPWVAGGPEKDLAVLSPGTAAGAQSGSDASVRHPPKPAVHQINIHPKKRVNSHLCLL